MSLANIGKFKLSLKALILSVFTFICFLVFSNVFCRTKIFLTSCCANAASGNEMTTTINVDSVGSDYTANATAIEQRKQEMLVVADSVGHFWFSDDTEFQSQDPHAYWLMNRMMQMVQLVQTADDDWAWILAMNESVEEYNSRLGRKIGSVDAAANAIDELINIYNAGNQPELNTASYVESILEHYKAVYAYYSLIEFIDDYDEDSNWDVQLRALYYREFKEWFDLNNAVNGIMYFYTYAAAGYSALSMDLNGTFEIWSKNRLAELDIEQDIYWSYDWKPFSSDAKNISAKKFEKLLSYFKTRTMIRLLKRWFPTGQRKIMTSLVNAPTVALILTRLQRWFATMKQLCQIGEKCVSKSLRCSQRRNRNHIERLPSRCTQDCITIWST